MKKAALVIGSSGGVGRALTARFSRLGWDVTGLSRSQHGFDITSEDSVRSHLSHLKGTQFDRIVVTTGALEINGIAPEKSIRQVTPENMLAHFQLNCIGPMLCLKHGGHLLPKQRESVFATLSARVGSIGDNHLGGWHSYRVSKAALNQCVRGAALQFARSHRLATVVALHPGTVQTPLTDKYVGRHSSVPPEQCADNLMRVMDNLAPEDTGLFFDWAGKAIPW